MKKPGKKSHETVPLRKEKNTSEINGTVIGRYLGKNTVRYIYELGTAKRSNLLTITIHRNSRLRDRVRGSSAGKPVYLTADWSALAPAHAACRWIWRPVSDGRLALASK